MIEQRAAGSGAERFLANVNGESLSYAELHQANLRWASGYQRLGVRAGHRVVTMLPNGFLAYSAWLGLAWLNAVEVPANNGYRGQMLGYLVANSGAETVVISERFLPQLLDVIHDLPNVSTVVVPDATAALPPLACRVLGPQDFLPPDSELGDFAGPSGHDTACVIYTSGTTGPSKGVLVPWGQFAQNATTFENDSPADTGATPECSYSFFPPFHISGKAALYGPVLHRTRIVFRETFSPKAFLGDIRRHSCTTTALGGPMAQMLLALPQQPDDADTTLRTVVVGPLFERWEVFCQRFGVRVATAYGMTEIGNPIASGWNPDEWRSCGRGRPGYELTIVDEHDLAVPRGTIGELIVRSDEPWVLNAGYLNLPDTTAQAWRNGWFHTGDAFSQDEVGNLYFVDRLKDTIRRRGENISSFEVESLVSQHPDVAECAAFGVPSELGEDEVKVCVVIREGAALTPDKLIEFLGESMPRFMLPRYVELVPGLPKTEATGRVKKHELKTKPFTDETWDREGSEHRRAGTPR